MNQCAAPCPPRVSTEVLNCQGNRFSHKLVLIPPVLGVQTACTGSHTASPFMCQCTLQGLGPAGASLELPTNALPADASLHVTHLRCLEDPERPLAMAEASDSVAANAGQQDEARSGADADTAQLALEPLAQLRRAHHAMALLARVRRPAALIAIAGVLHPWCCASREHRLYEPRAETRRRLSPVALLDGWLVVRHSAAVPHATRLHIMRQSRI